MPPSLSAPPRRHPGSWASGRIQAQSSVRSSSRDQLRDCAVGLPVLPQPHFSFLSLLGRASPQCCLTPWGLDVLAGSSGQTWDLLAPGFGIFLHFSRLCFSRCSFGRLDSLRTLLQLLFVTDFIPSIAFLVLEAEASWLETFPPWVYPVDQLGILFWHHSCSHTFPP